MNYKSGLEYIASQYPGFSSRYGSLSYFSRNHAGKYSGVHESVQQGLPYLGQYKPKVRVDYHNPYWNAEYVINVASEAHFQPISFLNPTRPKSKFVDDKTEIRKFAEEAFELMTGQKMPEIEMQILDLDDFKSAHSHYGLWSSGILGFSINGKRKKIFARENELDVLMVVLGHEIGHVASKTLPNKHDEEAKAFAFSIEWARTIKKHNIANLSSSIKDEVDFEPARNGLHDVALSFVNFMSKRRKAIDLHNDLVKRYISVFDRVYC